MQSSPAAVSREHTYATRLVWTGNRGTGTATYAGYGREHRISVDGKPDLEGSADAAFRGLADRHNPEDLFLAALSSCHMLAYLALCARHGVAVTAYEDHATGVLVLDPRGGGRFERVTLHPVVTVRDAAHRADALALHDAAHERCFIAASCAVPVGHEAIVRVERA